MNDPDHLAAGNGTDESNNSISGGILDIEITEQQSSPRPLQLPKIGWDDDGGDNEAIQPENTTDMAIPPVTNTEKTFHRSGSMSRSVQSDLTSIPEDFSIHGGAWPGYPDIVLCCDYDADKRKYRKCSPRLRLKLCALITVMAVIATGMMMLTNRQQKQEALKSQQQQLLQQELFDSEMDSQESRNNGYEGDGVDLYQAIVDSFDPIMFDDRTSQWDEWDGTYFHAYKFCGKEFSRSPCPYIAYCPMGPGRPPLGGVKVSSADSWAPINNLMHDEDGMSHNDWVQLGSKGTCELYTTRYGHPPEWGSFRGNGDMIQNETPTALHVELSVMCCTDSSGGAGDDRRSVSTDPDSIRRPPTLEEDEAIKPIPTPP